MPEYKLLLVDDDSIIRDEMRDYVAWEKHGFQFLAGCEDGKQAIDVIEKSRPDVIITDICMPFLDGLELSKYVSERFPKTKIILLTGYDEFNYAQKAVKLNAYDFILKPITPDDLISLLNKLKSDLDREQAQLKDMEELKIKVNESMPLLKERFLNKILSGRLNLQELQNRLNYFSIEFRYPYFSVLVLDIDNLDELKIRDQEENYELLAMNVQDCCKKFLKSQELEGTLDSQVFFNSNEYLVLIINRISIDYLGKDMIALAENIRQSVEQNCGCTVTIGIGTPAKSVMEIPVSYENAVSSLEYRFLMGNNQVICYTDLIQTQTVRMVSKRDWGKEITFSLKTEKPEKTKMIIHEMVENLKSSIIPIEKCNIYVQIVIASIYSILDELSITESEVFGNVKNPFVHLSQFKTLDHLEKWLFEITDRISELILEKKDEFDRQKINRGLKYIMENYNNENLSLSSICYFLCTSKSRFSPLFKKYTGQTFIEYLTRYRVNKAMELLKTTQLKTYEVANRSGFVDPHYFGLIFKKITNRTPSQYREEGSQNDDKAL